MKIGIVGLGAMGKPIALQLLEAGHAVTVWNRSRPHVTQLIRAGAVGADTVDQALQGDLTLSILFDDEAVRSVLMGPSGLALARPGCVHACMSTISAELARDLRGHHDRLGLGYAAAPMLGLPIVVERKGLNILAGADDQVLDFIETPLSDLGKVWRISSDPVQAHVSKLAANFMISGALEAMAEAAAVFEAYGGQPERFLSAMAETLFAAPIYRNYGPWIAGGTPPSPSGLTLPLKDNGLFLEAAVGSNIKLPLAEVVRSNLRQAVELGGVKDDWSTALARIARG